MDYLEVSPKKGIVTISRFTTVTLESSQLRKPENSKNANKGVVSECLCDLEWRMRAPLQLSASLRRRLPQ